MNHPLQCTCSKVKGFVADPRSANRVVCYCRDCQAFAHFLGHANDVLDERGGSDIIQILPKNLTFTQGFDALACIRLTEKGLVRWYASCCNTPIGNTLATPAISFIGLVHNCLEHGGMTLDEAVGPVRAWMNTKGAKGDPKPKTVGQGAVGYWFVSKVLKARINGDYKRTPLFRPDTGTPIVTPRVLSSGEHASVMKAVQGGD